MVYLIGIPLMVVLTILQSSIFNDFQILDGHPDLILLILISLALHEYSRPAIVLGFFAGLFLDLLSGLPLGLTSILLVGVLYLISLTQGRFWETNIVLTLAVTLITSLFYYLGSMIVLVGIGHGISIGHSLIRIILPSTLLNVLLAIPVRLLTHSIFRLVPAEPDLES